MASVLIVDDEYSILKTLALILKREGYEVSVAESIASAKDLLQNHDIDLVITDLCLGDSSGEELIDYLTAKELGAECIIITAYGSIESAVNCMRLGAYDYLTKPVNPEELIARVRRVIEKKRLRDEVIRLRFEAGVRGTLGYIISKSPQMIQVVEVIQRIRKFDMPVLITGETGTGKEVVAQAIHNVSRRALGPFIAINCCALPEGLLDSELFGHLKGAFTGATSAAKGLFEQADGGTLFLDEIGDISSSLQVKLLRVLQENEVRPVGGRESRKVDARVIAATNRDLPAMIANGDFRADLFFRLNVVPINIPPLRERREDILPLAERTIKKLRESIGSEIAVLSDDAWQKLLAYDYPGNVRQLENILERTFTLAKGPIINADDIRFDDGMINLMPGHEDEDGDGVKGEIGIDELVIRHIRHTLALHNGNQVAASRALGISRSTLRRKLGLGKL